MLTPMRGGAQVAYHSRPDRRLGTIPGAEDDFGARCARSDIERWPLPTSRDLTISPAISRDVVDHSAPTRAYAVEKNVCATYRRIPTLERVIHHFMVLGEPGNIAKVAFGTWRGGIRFPRLNYDLFAALRAP